MPIEGYDEMNVVQITAQLDKLSADELGQVREYEQRNKNRTTLIEQINNRLGTAS